MSFMNWYSFKNRIKYNWKRITAVTFASIGTAIEAALLISYLFLTNTEEISILPIVNYVIVLVAYYYLLAGNIKGTTLAYRGFTLFIFFNFIDFAQYILYFVVGTRGFFSAGNILQIAIVLAVLGFMTLGFVSGLLTYINFRRYHMVGYKTTYEKVRNWCLVFTICMLLAYGASIVSEIVLSDGNMDIIDIILAYLEPIGLICISFCSFITILRLKD